MKSFAAVIILSVMLSSCSSAPEFRPSTPPEEASSFENAIKSCSEYEIKGPTDGNGQPLMAEASTILPWIRCSEVVFRRFPLEGHAAQQHETFVMLFRALDNKRVRLTTRAQRFSWTRLNEASRLGWQAVLTPATFSPTEAERTVIEQELPSFAMYLAESGLFFTRPTDLVSTQNLSSAEPALGKTSLQTIKSGPAWYCAKANDLRQKKKQATSLKDYLDRIENSHYAEESLVLESKLRERWNALEIEVAREQSALKTLERDTLAHYPGFRVERCKKGFGL